MTSGTLRRHCSLSAETPLVNFRVIFGEEKVKWMNDDDDDIRDGCGDDDGSGAAGTGDDDDDVGDGWSLLEEYSDFLILIVSGDNV